MKFGVEQGICSEKGYWYKNIQFLGRGGTADTLLVLASSGPLKGVPFALKIFRRLSKPAWRENFLKEREFLETCDHPAIMRVYDRGLYLEEHPFVVAEYLPRTLASIIRSANATTVEKLSFTLQLLSALVYLSAMNNPVIHRDIKPQNIFIKGRSCVLGDFGLMKQVESKDEAGWEIFKESQGVGMPFEYRTPDLVDYLNGKSSISTKSDVFQLGLVIAELFTGRNPLVVPKKFTDDVSLNPIGRIPGAMSAGIENLITRMLEISPSARGDAGSFLDPWQGIFFDAVKRSHGLEGRAF